MTTFQIDARDPLIFRDGRPNDETSESRTMPFPLPSTLAGVVRTALGKKNGTFDSTLIDALLTKVSIRGPLLISANVFFVPAPRDCLVLQGEDKKLRIEPLVLTGAPEGAFHSSIGADRMLVGIASDTSVKAKPFAHTPRFWPWAAMEEWLRNPGPRDDDAARGLLSNAVVSLVRDERVHVAMTQDGTAEDGKLFAAEGLLLEGKRFDAKPNDHVPLMLLLDVHIGDTNLGRLAPGLRPLGGERRLSAWSESAAGLPSLPSWLVEQVCRDERVLVRVVMLTPACVESSIAPRKLERGSVARIVGAKVDRPLVVSGWDLAKNRPHGQPKKTRRLVESGTVYWVRMNGTPSERKQWLDDIWMQNISDDDQLVRDGFGLAAIGIGRQP